MFEKMFASFASAGRKVYNKCTFNNNVKDDKRRRIRIIESDSESSSEVVDSSSGFHVEIVMLKKTLQ